MAPPEAWEYRLASASQDAATALMVVLVDDVDEYSRFAQANGAVIEYEPVDQPCGYREYSARDCEGVIWSFMKALPAQSNPVAGQPIG